MNIRNLFVLLVIMALLAASAAAAPLSSPCTPGATYNPACDANQDGIITVADIQLTAGHWNQSGTFTSDNNHNHLGQTWSGASNPLKIQGTFGAPDYAPLVLSNSQGHGLSIPSASVDGVYVGSAGYYGMVVNAAAQDGVYVGAAGSPSSSTASVDSNGFEVAGAQGHGLFVGRADRNGLAVNSAGFSGVYVGSASLSGLVVNSAANYGLFVGLAGLDGVYANTAQANGQWGFNTPDAIHGSNVLLHSLSLVAQVTGPDSLTPGDIVAVAGVTDPVPGTTVHTPLVRLAGGTFTNVVGVVESHLALTQQPSHSQTAESETRNETPSSELRGVADPAQPGDYVAITVLGAARVKVQDGEEVLAGQRLTAGNGGSVRALQSRTVEGMMVTEGAPVIGVALDAPQDGMVWVLVTLK